MGYILLLFSFYIWENWVLQKVSSMHKVSRGPACKRMHSASSPCSWLLNYTAFHLSPDCQTLHKSTAKDLMPSTLKVKGPSTGHRQLYSEQKQEEGHYHPLGFVPCHGCQSSHTQVFIFVVVVAVAFNFLMKIIFSSAITILPKVKMHICEAKEGTRVWERLHALPLPLSPSRPSCKSTFMEARSMQGWW